MRTREIYTLLYKLYKIMVCREASGDHLVDGLALGSSQIFEL